MSKKEKYLITIQRYNLSSQIFYPLPSQEIDELYFYFDEISGDGRGLD